MQNKEEDQGKAQKRKGKRRLFKFSLADNDSET